MIRIINKFKSTLSQSAKNKTVHFPQAIIANLKYGFPSRGMTIIGVTGTDGKTTTTSGIYHLLDTDKRRAGMITTVECKLLDKHFTTGLHTTTPSAMQMQGLLKKAKENKITDMVIESTSHGLDQYRLWGIAYQIGVITNITHEHMDYHKTFEEYMLAKAKLFSSVKFAILNRDDQSFEFLVKYIKDKNPMARIISYGISDKADIKAKEIEYKENKTEFKFIHNFVDWENDVKVEIPYIGEFNVFNALAMISSAWAARVPLSTVIDGLATLPAVKGRQEKMEIEGREIVIDFAHTPNGMDSLLKSLKEIYPNSRLITLFGCTGERDRDKRPVMGEVAATLSDAVILTSDDTRSENIEDILDQIEPGCKLAEAILGDEEKAHIGKKKVYFRIPDRKKAVELAAKISEKGDVIAMLGKGHETTILLGKTEYPWSESQAIKDAFASLR